MSNQIGVFVVSTRRLYGARFEKILAAAPDITVIGTGSEVREAAAVAGYPASLQVVMVDLALPQTATAEFWIDLNTVCRFAEVVVVAGALLPPAPLLLAWQARTKGWVLMADPADEFCTAVRQAHAGRPYLRSPKLIMALTNLLDREAPQSFQAPQLRLLTKRQREVLALIAQGHSNKAIAARLNLSEGTVGQHLRSIYAALGVNNRTEASALYVYAPRASEKTNRARSPYHKGEIADRLLSLVIGDDEARGPLKP